MLATRDFMKLALKMKFSAKFIKSRAGLEIDLLVGDPMNDVDWTLDIFQVFIRWQSVTKQA